MYFECNLPQKAPNWMEAELAAKFQETVTAIYKRMDTLEKALELSGLSEETFAKWARELFILKQESTFDEMTAEQIADFANLMDDGAYISPRMDWPNATVVVDTAFVRTEEWETLRHIGIGGSEAAVIQGTSKYVTQSNLYFQKVGAAKKVIDKNEKSWVFDRGHVVESKVVEAFCNITGAKIVPETRMFASKKYPNCTANIDAIVHFQDGRCFVFEAKTTIMENYDEWKDGRIPVYYLPQTHQYPAVLDDDRIEGTYIGCLFTDDKAIGNVYIGSGFNVSDFVARFVPRDKDEEDRQLKAEEEWYNKYVVGREIPPMTGKASDTVRRTAGEIETLTDYVIGPADQSIPTEKWADAETLAISNEWLATKSAQKDYEKEAKALEEKAKALSVSLIEKLGAATKAVITLEDGKYLEIANSPRGRTSVDTEALEIAIESCRADLPEEKINALQNCIVVNPEAYRVFSIKERKARGSVRK